MFFEIFLAIFRRLRIRFQAFFCYPKLKQNAQAGFTLVELMTVISIMALIGSITLANTMEARRLARDTKTIQDVKSIIKVIQAYYLDHGYFPGLTASQASSPGNFYGPDCPTTPKCDYTAQNDQTVCDSRRPCDCLTSPTDATQREKRRQMGWLPMLDGTFGAQDAYFTPVSTPKIDRNINCEPAIILLHPFQYNTFYDSAKQKYRIFMEYFLDRPRSNAPGILIGCATTFCLYNLTEANMSF